MDSLVGNHKRLVSRSIDRTDNKTGKAAANKALGGKARGLAPLQPDPTRRIKPVHARSLNLQPDCITRPGLRLR